MNERQPVNEQQNGLQGIVEVRTTYDTDACNRYLKDGWVLLAVGKGQSQTAPHDYHSEFRYCLGIDAFQRLAHETRQKETAGTED